MTHIFGEDLSDGTVPGKVHFVQPEEPEEAHLLALRQMQEGTTVLMNVVMEGKGYSFRLEASQRPASIITFVDDAFLPQEGEEMKISKVALTSLARQQELLNLARNVSFLKPQFKEAYEGYSEVHPSRQVRLGSLLITIERVARFSRDDAIVVLGTVKNLSDKSLRIVSEGRLQVGANRVYQMNKVEVIRQVIQPEEETRFSGVLVGDGRGGQAFLALKNSFQISLTAKEL
ncbi:hypothetical protein AAFN60_19215 [Roseibacillus persicicus]|uniref:hypothetical protein n=1 Tax=Roseibacillus persicicus TaxID=454148 RepID=UPI00398AFADE